MKLIMKNASKIFQLMATSHDNTIFWWAYEPNRQFDYPKNKDTHATAAEAQT